MYYLGWQEPLGLLVLSVGETEDLTLNSQRIQSPAISPRNRVFSIC